MLWRNESLVGSFVLIAAPSPAAVASVPRCASVDAQKEQYAALTGAVASACLAAPSPALLASVLSFVVYVVDAQEEKYAALTGADTNACTLVSTESASP